MKNMNIGKQIRTLRNQYNISQEELAFAAGLSTNYLGSIERGSKNPTIRTLGQICDALHLPLSEFFRIQESEASVSEDDIYLNQLRTIFEAASSDEKKAILQIASIITNLSCSQK